MRGVEFEQSSQQQSRLPQGLTAATVPGAISVELLWLTVTLSNLTSYATALFPLGKMDSHGRAHILTANLGFAFYPPSSMAPCERLRCANGSYKSLALYPEFIS